MRKVGTVPENRAGVLAASTVACTDITVRLDLIFENVRPTFIEFASGLGVALEEPRSRLREFEVPLAVRQKLFVDSHGTSHQCAIDDDRLRRM